ncbi:MAG TPA: sigma factor [Rhodanobacteraceae bacterium]|nr:sigma factor [Rhodanobacteraceae bacterium]
MQESTDKAREAQFCQLLEENLGRLRRIARSYAAPDEREDLLQEMLMQLWRSLPGFDGRASQSTWVALGTLRRRYARPRERSMPHEQLLPQVWLGMRLALALWALSLTACIVRLWRVRAVHRLRTDMPLTAHLQACLERLRREMAYHQSLRWWFWVPFGVGYLMAIAQRLPATPNISWLAPVAVAAFWFWGFNEGPRVWPRRLQPELERLQNLLDRASTPAS